MAHILIYSNEWQLATLVKVIVSLPDVESWVASSRDEFGRLTEHRAYDLVIIVGVAPLLSDVGLLQRLRPRPLQRPPIYVLSWQQGEQTVLSMLECGVDQYLTFPIHPMRLRNKVIEALSR